MSITVYTKPLNLIKIRKVKKKKNIETANKLNST